jgi:UDP-N-acetylmuramoyl-L-alanyl-D-glutamate--2,6-diaminopimelate ligase
VNLGQLAAGVPGARIVGDGNRGIEGITFDSRAVRPGDLFIALPGTAVDGTHYVPDALAREAAAVVVERDDAIPSGQSGLVVPSARRALALLSAQWEGYPSRQLRLIGVTGTDGKTTTSSLIAAILRSAGRRVGLVTTVSAEIGDESVDTGFHTTTPDAPDLQRYLRRMVDTGAEDAVLEVTSHGLAQERVAGCEFDVAVITNVTGDHLDYHRTFEHYLRAKLRLFAELDESLRKPGVPKCAVYNLDDPSAEPIAGLPVERRLSYALERPADVSARDVRLRENSAEFAAQTPGGTFDVKLPLPGWYNVANALAAIGAGLALDVPVSAIQEGIAGFAGIPGRFEVVSGSNEPEVVVDFAHTTNSLSQVLAMARERRRGRILVVFGCAGLRDHHKRPLMGEVAGRLADRVYLTAEDPRTECLDDILEEIAAGCRSAGREEGADFWRIPDRATAIQQAIDDAEQGDLVLVTGKGHERSMCFGTVERPWSDHDAIRTALSRRYGPAS